MSKVNLSAVITSYDGKPMKDGGESDKDATLQSVCFGAMTAVLDGDNAMTGEEKMRAYKLTQKLVEGGEVELSAEEITELKKRINKAYHFLVVGRAFELLEGQA